MRLDRKLLLIAPTIVLLFVIAGLGYTALQLDVLGRGGHSFQERSDFISAVERGEKSLETRQAVGILRLSLDVEAKRTAALSASRDLIIGLSGIALVSCVVLALGIRSVPREHWPRMDFRRSRTQ